jgi:hypothetical protein
MPERNNDAASDRPAERFPKAFATEGRSRRGQSRLPSAWTDSRTDQDKFSSKWAGEGGEEGRGTFEKINFSHLKFISRWWLRRAGGAKFMRSVHK